MASIRHIAGRGFRLEWHITVQAGPQRGQVIRGSQDYQLGDTPGNRRTMQRIRTLKEASLAMIRAGDAKPTITWEKFLADYAGEKRQNKTVKQAIRTLADLAETTAIQTTADFTATRIDAYVQHRRAGGSSDNVIRQVLQVASAAMTYATRRDLVDSNPFAQKKIILPPAAAPRDRFLTRDEFARFLTTCRARDPVGQSGRDRDHAIRFAWHTLFIANTGLRITEYITAKRADFFGDRLRVYGKGKNGRAKVRTVPINYLAGRAIKHLAGPADSPLLFSACKRRPWRNKYIRHFARAGLEKIGPHILRKTCGSWLAMAGVPLATIAAVLGHSNIQTTINHYLFLTPDYLIGATRSFRYHCRR